MQSLGNELVLFAGNWLHLLSVGHCFGQELQIEQEKRKGEKKKKNLKTRL